MEIDLSADCAVTDTAAGDVKVTVSWKFCVVVLLDDTKLVTAVVTASKLFSAVAAALAKLPLPKAFTTPVTALTNDTSELQAAAQSLPRYWLAACSMLCRVVCSRPSDASAGVMTLSIAACVTCAPSWKPLMATESTVIASPSTLSISAKPLAGGISCITPATAPTSLPTAARMSPSIPALSTRVRLGLLSFSRSSSSNNLSL